MPTTDEIKEAESSYNVALANLSKCLVGNAAFGTESAYGQAYQKLVRLGVRPQLRGKYRQ